MLSLNLKGFNFNILNIYNIIDTSIIDTLDDFKKLYDAGNYFKDLVVGSCKSMAIVLLDDSTVKHNVANEIRLYLADNGEAYDGVIVVANRTYGDSIYEMKDLYKIAANVIILSNNDSFSQMMIRIILLVRLVFITII